MAEGNTKAFGLLFHAWKDKLYSFMWRLTGNATLAEDIVQDVFLKIWHTKEELREVKNFNAYLFTIAHHHGLNLLKRMAIEKRIIAEIQHGPLQGYPQEELIAEKQLQEWVNEAINRLPAQQKKVYVLFREKGLSQQEIASRLNLSLSSVKNHSSLALKTIRKLIQEKYPESGMIFSFLAPVLFCGLFVLLVTGR